VQGLEWTPAWNRGNGGGEGPAGVSVRQEGFCPVNQWKGAGESEDPILDTIIYSCCGLWFLCSFMIDIMMMLMLKDGNSFP